MSIRPAMTIVVTAWDRPIWFVVQRRVSIMLEMKCGVAAQRKSVSEMRANAAGPQGRPIIRLPLFRAREPTKEAHRWLNRPDGTPTWRSGAGMPVAAVTEDPDALVSEHASAAGHGIDLPSIGGEGMTAMTGTPPTASRLGL